MWMPKFFHFRFCFLQSLSTIRKTLCKFSLGHIDEKALDNMSYVLKITENMRLSYDKVDENEIAKYFPLFYWVLRDFSLDLKGSTESEYLENSLKPINNDDKDPKNQIRKKIRKLFSQRRCGCFPRPLN